MRPDSIPIPIPAPARPRTFVSGPGRSIRLPRLLAGLLVVLAAAATRPAAADPPGFAFLEVPSGARAAAMGGAYTTFAEGSDAALWNPAGLAALERFELFGAHAELVEGLRHESFVVGVPVSGGGIAASLRALYSEPIVARDETGNEIGTFGAHDLEFGLSYGWRHHDRLRFGAGAQIVRERIEESSATTYAFSFGAAWDPSALPDWRLAFALQNAGPGGAFTIENGEKGQTVALPISVQSGVQWRAPAIGMWQPRAALDARFTAGRPALVMLGGELGQATGAAVRLGYRVNDDAASFTMGAGWATTSLGLDYAYVPARLDLGDTHRVSFTARF